MSKPKKGNGKKSALINTILDALAKYNYKNSDDIVNHLDFGVSTGYEALDKIIDNNEDFVVVDVISPGIIGGYLISIFRSDPLNNGECIMPKVSSVLSDAVMAGLLYGHAIWETFGKNCYDILVDVVKDGRSMGFSTPIGYLTIRYIRPIDIIDKTLGETRDYIADIIFQIAEDLWNNGHDTSNATIVLPDNKEFNWSNIIELYDNPIILYKQTDELRKVFIPLMLTDYIHTLIRSIYKPIIYRSFGHGTDPVPKSFKRQYKYLEKIACCPTIPRYMNKHDEDALPPKTLKEYLEKHKTRLIAEGILNPHYLEIDDKGLFTSK